MEKERGGREGGLWTRTLFLGAVAATAARGGLGGRGSPTTLVGSPLSRPSGRSGEGKGGIVENIL